MKLYLVMQVIDYPHFQVGGIFDTEDKAIAACRTEDYCFGEIELNKPAPHWTIILPGCYPKNPYCECGHERHKDEPIKYTNRGIEMRNL